MNFEKYYRVESAEIELGKLFDTSKSNYGKNFDQKDYEKFFEIYFRVMDQLNISVDFLISLSNQIYYHGDNYLKIVSNSIVDEEYIDIFSVTKNINHKNQRIPIALVNEFIQSFDEDNQFVFFNEGTILWEQILEKVRKNNFKNLPNRLDSTFFFDNISSCEYYIDKHLGGIGKMYEIEIIEIEEMFTADMKIIDGVNNQIRMKELIDEFTNYWKGITHENSIRELVFKGAFKYRQIL